MPKPQDTGLVLLYRLADFSVNLIKAFSQHMQHAKWMHYNRTTDMEAQKKGQIL